MCIGIYFVDKEIVQHCKVSVKMWERTRIKMSGLQIVDTPTVDFVGSHSGATGCPGMLQECHWSAHILPF